jgi:hypothetical protein
LRAVDTNARLYLERHRQPVLHRDDMKIDQRNLQRVVNQYVDTHPNPEGIRNALELIDDYIPAAHPDLHKSIDATNRGTFNQSCGRHLRAKLGVPVVGTMKAPPGSNATSVSVFGKAPKKQDGQMPLTVLPA